MPTLHHAKGEAIFKIVYCGPPGGGKTSNLRYIHRRLDPQWRGDLLSVATEQDRTLCFDFLPMAAMLVSGLRTRFQLFTVPGQEIVKEARRSVLRGVDAVVFVADSAPERMAANLAAHRDMIRCIEENGLSAEAVPVCYQYNKRDLPGGVRPDDLDEAFGVRSAAYLACALSGYQIFATLDAVTKAALRAFHRDRAAVPRGGEGEGAVKLERSLVAAGA
jgi:signal recognition particle receptor subunit beta